VGCVWCVCDVCLSQSGCVCMLCVQSYTVYKSINIINIHLSEPIHGIQRYRLLWSLGGSGGS